MDSTFEGHGPQPGYSSNDAIFYIIYFVVFPYFFLNIFVALLVVSYKEQNEDELSGYELDLNQVRFKTQPYIVRLHISIRTFKCYYSCSLFNFVVDFLLPELYRNIGH